MEPVKKGRQEKDYLVEEG